MTILIKNVSNFYIGFRNGLVDFLIATEVAARGIGEYIKFL